MAITLTKESTANTVAVCEQVVTELNRIKEDPDLAEFELHMYLNQGGIVMSQLNTLFSNGKIGAFFAAIILYLFLRRFRITLIITLAIPLCLFMSVAVMYFAGESLNLLTILGLVICVGLLVDNSVVVAENIQRHYLSGMLPTSCMYQGCSGNRTGHYHSNLHNNHRFFAGFIGGWADKVFYDALSVAGSNRLTRIIGDRFGFCATLRFSYT